MARIRLLVSVAGEDGWYPGQVVDVDEAVAATWCDGVRAVRVDDDPPAPPEPMAWGGPPDLWSLSTEELWGELADRGCVVVETGVGDVAYRVEAIATAEPEPERETPADPEEPHVPAAEPPAKPPKPAEPTKRGRPPKAEKAVAPPGGEMR